MECHINVKIGSWICYSSNKNKIFNDKVVIYFTSKHLSIYYRISYRHLNVIPNKNITYIKCCIYSLTSMLFQRHFMTIDKNAKCILCSFFLNCWLPICLNFNLLYLKLCICVRLSVIMILLHILCCHLRLVRILLLLYVRFFFARKIESCMSWKCG